MSEITKTLELFSKNLNRYTEASKLQGGLHKQIYISLAVLVTILGKKTKSGNYFIKLLRDTEITHIRIDNISIFDLSRILTDININFYFHKDLSGLLHSMKRFITHSGKSEKVCLQKECVNALRLINNNPNLLNYIIIGDGNIIKHNLKVK